MVRYRYDAWGNVLSKTVNVPCIASNYNPFIYKGYMYDEETGWYYLQSRYYIPSLCRFLSPDSIDYADPETIGGLNLFAYCNNNPINCVDYSGHSLEWLGGAGKILTGISAVVTGILVLTSGVAALPMLIVAGITVAAGVLTVVNGAAEIQQSVNGKNFVRDGMFEGNQTAYNWYAGITEGISIIGSMICGGWLKANQPRIQAYKNIESATYPSDYYSREISSRYFDSVLTQKNVIKYGKMTKSIGQNGKVFYNFTANGQMKTLSRHSYEIVNSTVNGVYELTLTSDYKLIWHFLLRS